MVERPEVQAILMAPGTVPLDQRETAAALLAADLMGEMQDVEPLDLTTMVIHSLFQSKAWMDARKFAEDRPDLIPELLVLALPQVLRTMENGLGGLDWSELSEGDRRDTEDLLEALLNPDGRDGKEIEFDGSADADEIRELLKWPKMMMKEMGG